jgi:hypothetical protein
MTAIDSVLPRLKTEEGFRMRVYRDTAPNSRNVMRRSPRFY